MCVFSMAPSGVLAKIRRQLKAKLRVFTLLKLHTRAHNCQKTKETLVNNVSMEKTGFCGNGFTGRFHGVMRKCGSGYLDITLSI